MQIVDNRMSTFLDLAYENLTLLFVGLHNIYGGDEVDIFGIFSTTWNSTSLRRAGSGSGFYGPRNLCSKIMLGLGSGCGLSPKY
jgi:hypothetical protein